jgi:hypothetical protein
MIPCYTVIFKFLEIWKGLKREAVLKRIGGKYSGVLALNSGVYDALNEGKE